MKTRLQTPHLLPVKDGKTKYGMITLFLHIKEQENIKMLWAGTVPSLIRGVPGGGIYFMAYDWFKNTFFPNQQRINTIQSIGIGVFARTISDVAVIPLSVIKTRMESGVYKYKSFLSGMKQIYTHEGWRGLTSGLVPTLARDVPLSGMYVMCYIQSLELVPLELRQSHPYTINFTCATIASIFSAIITHPPDVIQTHMQLFPDKYKSISPVITDIWLQDGFPGFYRGIILRLMKRTILATISWTLYEKVKAESTK
ncbi:mitochondrial glycine transporter A-like isoform X2 [Diorhabda carinulata]|nr:mitochondrial glycine transporter A-like isoform X2 [Diorhabda carinulata]